MTSIKGKRRSVRRNAIMALMILAGGLRLAQRVAEVERAAVRPRGDRQPARLRAR
jgi:hypothetical protein